MQGRLRLARRLVREWLRGLRAVGIPAPRLRRALSWRFQFRRLAGMSWSMSLWAGCEGMSRLVYHFDKSRSGRVRWRFGSGSVLE